MLLRKVLPTWESFKEKGLISLANIRGFVVGHKLSAFNYSGVINNCTNVTKKKQKTLEI